MSAQASPSGREVFFRQEERPRQSVYFAEPRFSEAARSDVCLPAIRSESHAAKTLSAATTYR